MLLRSSQGEEVFVLLWTDRKDRLCVRYPNNSRSAYWRSTPFGRHPQLWRVKKYSSDEGQALIRAGIKVLLANDVEPERRCSLCGCHDLAACTGGCHWVAADICSRCEETKLQGRRPMSGEDFLR